MSTARRVTGRLAPMPMQRIDRRIGRRLTAVVGAVLIAVPAATAATTNVKKPLKTVVKTPVAKTLHWAAAGNRSLGTVKLTTDSVVRWTDKAGSFSLRDASGRLKASSRTVGGETFVARGTYRKVTVTARGAWTLTITPLPASHR
jgi:hypothetical protein